LLPDYPITAKNHQHKEKPAMRQFIKAWEK